MAEWEEVQEAIYDVIIATTKAMTEGKGASSGLPLIHNVAYSRTILDLAEAAAWVGRADQPHGGRTELSVSK